MRLEILLVLVGHVSHAGLFWTRVTLELLFWLRKYSGLEFLGIPLASEILLLEHSSQAGREEAGKEGNGLFLFPSIALAAGHRTQGCLL